jgi:Predicted integral membrane protein
MENVAFMRMAKESLRDKWGLAIGTFLVYTLIVNGLQFNYSFYSNMFGTNMLVSSGGLLSLIIGGPMTLGTAYFALAISRNQEARFEQLFKGFNNFGTALGAYLLMAIFTVLWMLLLIIPGIIAAISYSMTFYIIADDPSIGSMEAIDKSKKMMYGYKWKFFCLNLRFLGWAILCIFTLGIGFLWLIPYMEISFAKFYDDINGSQTAEEAVEGDM